MRLDRAAVQLAVEPKVTNPKSALTLGLQSPIIRLAVPTTFFNGAVYYGGPLGGPFILSMELHGTRRRFIDAGYLFAQGGRLLPGRKVVRSELTLDHVKAAEVLQQFAERVTEEKLLRIYWYDGTSTGPTTQHIALAYLPGLKVRLGFVNSVGEQKGVDSLIVTDMIALARNRAMTEAVLLSGDEDLRVGVQQAQEFGVRVHLLGIKPSRGSQSVFLLQEADSTHEWSEADLSPFLGIKTGEAPVINAEAPIRPPIGNAEADPLLEVASAAANERSR